MATKPASAGFQNPWYNQSTQVDLLSADVTSSRRLLGMGRSHLVFMRSAIAVLTELTHDEGKLLGMYAD
ncbi:MAG: hypothetical protein AAFQ89_23575 [Cyanobacteria bacterium J06626_18]